MVAIKGYNPSYITAWQMFVHLPNGIEMESGDAILNDRYPWIENTQIYAHNADIIKVDDNSNSYMIMCYADKPSVIYGETGILASLRLRCSSSYKGQHEARISNVAVANFNDNPKQTNQVGDILMLITDEKTAAIEGMVAEQNDNDTEIMTNLSGQRVDKPERKGVYIRDGKKIIVR